MTQDDLCILVPEVSWKNIHREFDRKVAVSKVVCKMGPANAHWRPPVATSWLFSWISSPLCRQKWQPFGFYCHLWWNLGVPVHTRSQTMITLVVAFLLTQTNKIQMNTVSWYSHSNYVLKSKRGIVGEFHGFGNRNICFETMKTFRQVIQNQRRGMLSKV